MRPYVTNILTALTILLAPTLVFAACPGGLTITPTVTITANIPTFSSTVSTPTAVDSVDYYIDSVKLNGSNLRPNFAPGPTSFPNVGHGVHTFFAIMNCTAGGTQQSTTQTVTTTDSPVCTGGTYACAVFSNTLQCWGGNDFGQLGNGSTTDSLTPHGVTGGAGARSVVCGDTHVCALFSGGVVKCWGQNNYGQVGDGTITNRTAPVTVIASGATQISAQSYSTCATVGGAAKCWGENNTGVVGDGTTTDRHSPTGVSGLTSGVAQVTAGVYVACAITTAGALKCWGTNTYGNLGNGTTTNSFTPTPVTGLTSGVSMVSSGTATCAVQNGGLKCWGANPYGGVGNGTTANALSPVSIFTSNVLNVLAGQAGETCGVISTGAQCWGLGFLGTLGNGTTTLSQTTPVGVSTHSTLTIQAGSNSFYSACDVKDGHIYCWGPNTRGQIGNGTLASSTTPAPVTGL